jgi:hypothetical protein
MARTACPSTCVSACAASTARFYCWRAARVQHAVTGLAGAELFIDGGFDLAGTLPTADLAGRSKLILDGIDAWLLTQPSLVNARKRSLLPAVLQRQTLADGLARYLGQLSSARGWRTLTRCCSIARMERITTPASRPRCNERSALPLEVREPNQPTLWHLPSVLELSR